MATIMIKDGTQISYTVKLAIALAGAAGKTSDALHVSPGEGLT